MDNELNVDAAAMAHDFNVEVVSLVMLDMGLNMAAADWKSEGKGVKSSEQTRKCLLVRQKCERRGK
jgi:hypothetical protein